MSDNKYPLDITVACALGLEGGLKKYPFITASLPNNTMELVHNWNRALIHTIFEKGYKKYMGGFARVIAWLRSPRFAADILDKIAVPYRSYHYAKRFELAYKFNKDILKKADFFGRDWVQIVDFGRGLSPLDFVINHNNRNSVFFTFDNNITNDLFNDVLKQVGAHGYQFSYNVMPKNINPKKDVYMSLGTYTYLSHEEQLQKLQTAINQFDNIFVELDIQTKIKPEDDKLVEKLGANYNLGWTPKELAGLISHKDYSSAKVLTLHEDLNNENIEKKLVKANEVFLKTVAKSYVY